MKGFELFAVIALVCFSIGDLIAGVINDAVNFINSAVGAKVSSRKVILSIAAVGILLGVTFSDGLIEVARKGIFDPSFFTIREVIILFAAVAFTDIILLDLFSTFGIPTSTTVSVVFELFGAAIVLAFLKFGSIDKAWEVINSDSALKIVSGILLSIVIAFVCGLIVQFITRMIFTFDYNERFQKFGFLWSGIALTCLLFYVILDGGKHATFLDADSKAWISAHTIQILFTSLLLFTAVSYVLILRHANLFKYIILIGTGALALAFAGNDLVNFIGVSVGGVHAYLGHDLAGNLPTPTWTVLLAGLIMIFALFTSKKAHTVTNTEVHLGSHNDDAVYLWGKNSLSEKFVRMIVFLFGLFLKCIPHSIRIWVRRRFQHEKFIGSENKAAFDLLRASVNLMISAALISIATANKLPLSTTFVTFMVAMGTSLADGAWDERSAASRVTGVSMVVISWFFTALAAVFLTGITVSILYFLEVYGLVFLIIVLVITLYKLSHLHNKRERSRHELHTKLYNEHVHKVSGTL